MSLFRNLFPKKETLEAPVDLSVLKTDIHSHLIPGIDDGSNSMEDSIEMILAFQELGYTKLITTPHVMSDTYRNSSSTIQQGCNLVREELDRRSIKMELEVAAEYYLDEHFESLIKQKDLLTFGDNYVLFELSFMSEPLRVFEVIFELQTAGYNPVLAHPERYNYYNDDISKYDKFLDRGVKLQLNMNSISGGYSPASKKSAKQMIDNHMVSFLGSDCHHMGHIAGIVQETVLMKSLQSLIDSGMLLNDQL